MYTATLGRATRVRVYIHTPLFLNKFECLGAWPLQRLSIFINDLVTAVIPGGLGWPSENLFVRMEPRLSITVLDVKYFGSDQLKDLI